MLGVSEDPPPILPSLPLFATSPPGMGSTALGRCGRGRVGFGVGDREGGGDVVGVGKGEIYVGPMEKHSLTFYIQEENQIYPNKRG